MMRNASCFVNLFHVNNWLHLLKVASKSNLLLVQQSLSNLSIKVSDFCIRMPTKRLTQLHPKVIASGVKQHLSSQSLHPFQATTFYNQPFSHKNLSTPSLAHQQWSFTVFCFNSSSRRIKQINPACTRNNLWLSASLLLICLEVANNQGGGRIPRTRLEFQIIRPFYPLSLAHPLGGSSTIRVTALNLPQLHNLLFAASNVF